MKNYLTSLLTALLVILCLSCEKDKDTNDNNPENQQIPDSLLTINLDSLLDETYLTLRAWYGKNVGYTFSEFGTDIYTMGSDNRTGSLYNSSLSEEFNIANMALRRELDRGITNSSMVKLVASYQAEDNTQNKAEACFLRALYSWLVVEIWGSTDVDSVYTQIIADLDTAVYFLPATYNAFGHVGKTAAQAFRARIHLTRHNYTEALSDVQAVIASSYYSLVTDYSDIWEIENRSCSEIIYSLDNTTYPDPLFSWYEAHGVAASEYETSGLEMREGGHQGHLMWEIRYENTGWGMTRDLENGRGFQRYAPTRFFIDLFDESEDERFYSSFKNVWYCNSSTAIPLWPTSIYINGIATPVDAGKVGTPLFNVGDTAILFVKQPWNGSRAKLSTTTTKSFHPDKGYLIMDRDDMYLSDGSFNVQVNERKYYFPITHKFKDLTRADMTQQYSSRNAMIIRLAEMYLIAAEASMELGNTSEAYNYLITLANARSYTGNGAALLSTYGVNSGSDINIDFILDERARELAAEQLRWFDLKRTDKLIERVSLYNSDDGGNIQYYHTLRPLPQYLLDKGYTQNPGYSK